MLAPSDEPCTISVFQAFHLRTETDPVSEMLWPLEYRTMSKVQKLTSPELRRLKIL
jgi:hypothetical protein